MTKNYKDIDWLHNQYITLKKSTRQIASESNCGKAQQRIMLNFLNFQERIQKLQKYHQINQKTVKSVENLVNQNYLVKITNTQGILTIINMFVGVVIRYTTMKKGLEKREKKNDYLL